MAVTTVLVHARLGGGATGKKQDLCYYVDAQCLILVKSIIILYTLQAFILLKYMNYYFAC